jgi:16S rRNA (adenine1518-N6/adenine1519-N6)-dimethyltransferase
VTWRDPRTILRNAELRPKKALGQNFLVSEQIAQAIARACVPDEDVGRARVVEIGPGTGALTVLLAVRARSVTAVERDPGLVHVLEREASGGHVRVMEGDARAVDLGALLGEADAASPRVLCGNLPYAITGPLMRHAIACADHLERAVFMVQREVADRLTASPGGKEWGALTVFVLAAYEVRRILRAPPGAFHPRPDVESAVVELTPLRPPLARETPRFRALVRAAFEARRKTLRNAWSRLAPDGATLEKAARLADVSLDARGDTLGVEAFARMASALDGLT